MTQTQNGGEPRRLDISDDADVVRVRQVVRVAAVAAQLSLVDQTKIITAASELARNTLVHGGGGRVELEMIHNGRRRGLRVRFTDDGPGIADVDQALTGGFSSRGGLGLGLSGSRRLVDEFDIHTGPGQGTRVVIIKWNR